jgi:hypothetical protein
VDYVIQNRLTRENQCFFVNGEEVPGIVGVQSQYQANAVPLRFLGMDCAAFVPNGPQEGQFSVQTLLINKDFFLPFTGNSGFNGYSIQGRANPTKNFGFTSGYLENYVFQCAIGQIPSINANIRAFGNVGLIDNFENMAAANDFYSISGSSGFTGDLQIASPGHVTLNLNDFSTNRLNSFTVSIQIPRTPFYELGSRFPSDVEINWPIEVLSTFEFEITDYQFSTLRTYPCSPKAEHLQLAIKTQDNRIISSFSLPDSVLISENISAPSDGQITVSATYKTYLTRPNTQAVLINSPAAITGYALDSNVIYLFWSNSSNNENNFILEYRKESQTEFSRLDVIPSDTTSYIHSGLEWDTLYYYRVKGARGETESAYSPIAIARTPEQTIQKRLLNFSFQHQAGTTKVGTGAIGSSTDVWNYKYKAGNENSVVFADGTAATSFRQIDFNKSFVTPEQGTHPDNMFKTVLRTLNGGVMWTVYGLDTGTYNFYIFAHGPYTSGDNSQVILFKNGLNQGEKMTFPNASWSTLPFRENVHYVTYTGIPLGSRDFINFYWEGWMNGVQIFRV